MPNPFSGFRFGSQSFTQEVAGFPKLTNRSITQNAQSNVIQNSDDNPWYPEADDDSLDSEFRCLHR